MGCEGTLRTHSAPVLASSRFLLVALCVLVLLAGSAWANDMEPGYQMLYHRSGLVPLAVAEALAVVLEGWLCARLLDLPLWKGLGVSGLANAASFVAGFALWFAMGEAMEVAPRIAYLGWAGAGVRGFVLTVLIEAPLVGVLTRRDTGDAWRGVKASAGIHLISWPAALTVFVTLGGLVGPHYRGP